MGGSRFAFAVCVVVSLTVLAVPVCCATWAQSQDAAPAQVVKAPASDVTPASTEEGAAEATEGAAEATEGAVPEAR